MPLTFGAMESFDLAIHLGPGVAPLKNHNNNNNCCDASDAHLESGAQSDSRVSLQEMGAKAAATTRSANGLSEGQDMSIKKKRKAGKNHLGSPGELGWGWELKWSTLLFKWVFKLTL